MKKYTLLLISLFFFAICTMAQQRNEMRPAFSDTLLFEDWSSDSFATNQWIVNLVDTSGLTINNADGNPAPSAKFILYEFWQTCSLTSKTIQGTNQFTELRYDIDLSNGSNAVIAFYAEIFDGSVWRLLDLIEGNMGSFPWTTHVVNISDYCHNNFKIRFRTIGQGAVTDHLDIDNIIIGSFPLGIAEHQNADFIIKPNPAKSNFDLVLKNFENQNTRIVISDLTGKTIYTEGFVPRAKESTIRVNTENFPRGIYFCKIQSEKTTLIRKLILD